jgi:hypothetical protein
MKKIILLMLFINISMVYANENYKFRIMGNSINNDITELPDKSIFNIFEGKGAFTDNDGNIGDFFSKGVRQTNNKGVLKKLIAILVFETTDGSVVWGTPSRSESELDIGAGFFDIFYASGNLKKLSNKRCKYGLTPTKNESFVMEGFCK